MDIKTENSVGSRHYEVDIENGEVKWLKEKTTGMIFYYCSTMFSFDDEKEVKELIKLLEKALKQSEKDRERIKRLKTRIK